MHADYSARIYANAGNPAVVSLVDAGASVVLDVGCGAGDTASLLKLRDPDKEIYGVTASPGEAELASRWMEHCWVADLELPLPSEVSGRQYDVIVCSHVLEHLRSPASVVERLCSLLRIGGSMVIAVPNVAFWLQRWHFLMGRFEYQATGTMDETHLRFFTYHTADHYLLACAPELRLVEKRAVGSVPLWILRRTPILERMARPIDHLGASLRPNFFGGEVLLKARKTSAS